MSTIERRAGCTSCDKDATVRIVRTMDEYSIDNTFCTTHAQSYVRKLTGQMIPRSGAYSTTEVMSFTLTRVS